MSLTVSEILLPSANFNGESTLPSLYEMSNVQNLTMSTLDEDDELFIGYGFLPSLFPYKMQDLYDRADGVKPYIGVVLENEYLKAVFLPEMGGRLWSLYDKVKDKDLLYTNPMIRPCNLSVRNAWLAGGIEFNCGMVGHSPFTCSRIHAAEAKLDDGTPVLRMYEYERIRACVYQMDFFLPEDSKQLFGRMRIVNPTNRTTPMYWWSNIAVREDKNARNVIDATQTYNNDGGVVGKNEVPFRNGVDITYPTNNPIALDYFWKIPKDKRKYTAYIDKDGYGFYQTSTSRLQGRKLFVWGQGEGGSRWQEFLTADGHDGRYVEIQAGLAHTQYECIPMPPKTAWEWLEAYGAIETDPQKVHGDWADARNEVGACIEHMIADKKLEEMLKDTKKMATSPAESIICHGSAYGKLENYRREKCDEAPICEHLDFGDTGEAHALWMNLLETGSMAQPEADFAKPPVSWMLQPEWTGLIEKSEDCHEKYLHLAAVYMAQRMPRDANEAIEKALSFGETSTALFLKAQIHRMNGDKVSAAKTAFRAYNLLPGDLSLARQVFALMLTAGLYSEIIEAYTSANDNITADGRVTMLYAFALLRSGRVDDAYEALTRGEWLFVTDIREGEISITNLYIEIAIAKAKEKGEELSACDVDVPRRFDFRMQTPKKK